jgi:acetate kinase
VLWLQRHAGLGGGELEHLLEHESGLLGLSGVSGDLEAVIQAADAGHRGAALAFGVYVHRLRGAIAAKTGALGGIDGLVFTRGAGEHSPRLRAATCAGLGFLGLALDEARNHQGGEGIISVPAGAAVGVVEAREDLEIARQVRGLLRG